MTSSYRTVNYSLRPAKTVERKMLCDFFKRIESFDQIMNYQYIGFGSIYYSDFILFHQVLGICDMISIEKNDCDQKRFEFNRPYRCIDLKIGHSNVLLPTLNWNKRCIAWLDYDGKLDKKVLADVSTVCTKAPSGSFLLISINVTPDKNEPGKSDEEMMKIRLENFRNSVGEEKVPADFTGKELRGKDFMKACRQVFFNEIVLCLTDRNGTMSETKKIKYSQLFYFSYSDNAEMMTIGGIFCDNEDDTNFNKIDLTDLAFIRKHNEPCKINTPLLTPKEIRYINTLLPSEEEIKENDAGIPEKDMQNYASIYRYYPSFVEIIHG